MSVEKLLKVINKLVIGKKEVLKNLKNGLISEVYAAQNCDEHIFKELENAAKLSGASINMLDLNSEELAAQLKKSFNITIIGVKKEK